ncbi:MAG: tetratricopeptide repeat protein [Chloroflexota bacterium]|nr:tetratricopeptide repeat protein [Chloroflexota bacterium]
MMTQRFDRPVRPNDPLPTGVDAEVMQFTEFLDRLYTPEIPPAAALGDAAVMRAVRERYATRSRGLVMLFPVRGARSLPVQVRWWVALLIATFTFGGGLAAAQTLPRHTMPISTGGAPSPAAQAYAQAERLRAANHCDRAIPLYRRAIAAYATYVSAYVGLGFCYQVLGSYAAAITTFDKAIRIDPTNYLLYFYRADLEAQAGRMGAAMGDYRAALRLSPPQVPSYLAIAQGFLSIDDFPDALGAVSKAITLTPSNPSLYEQRANIYLQASDDQHAYADYRRAIQLAPTAVERARLYADLAGVYAGQRDYDPALAAIAAAIRLQPGDAHLYVVSGGIHLAADQLPAALSLYDHALRFVSTGLDAEAAHEGKGDVLVAQGHRAEAIGEYKRALKLATPGDTTQRLNQKIHAAR